MLNRRTRVLFVAAAACVLAMAVSAGPAAGAPARPHGTVPTTASTDAADQQRADAIVRIVRDSMRNDHLRAVIVKVTIDGRRIIERAFGESMTGVPATTDMHFRNGAVAIGYMANLLLQLVDDGVVSLDDKVSRWLPDLPNADRVTLGQLARMTSGYPDFVHADAFVQAFLADPFRAWTPEERLAFVMDEPLLFEPGTMWGYAHTNYVILGLALEKITGKPLAELLRTRVLDPLGLDQTTADETAAVPPPVLHAFSGERRDFLGIPTGTPFLEESTFWNPSWTLARGSVQTTDIDDLHTTAIAFGTGELLSRESYRAMVSTDLRGFGGPVAGCGPSCFTQSEGYSYGIGMVTTGNWVLQNPMFAGSASVAAYLPSQEVAIAVSVTFEEEAFADGFPPNQADRLFRAIGGALAPKDAPPVRR